LAEAAPSDRAEKRCQRGGIQRADPAADVLKARRQIAAGTEEECLDGADAHPALVGDLRIRESLPLAQKNGPTLARGKMGEPVSKRGATLIHFVAGGRWRGEFVDVLDLVHDRALAAGRPPRPSADVERDLEQPGVLKGAWAPEGSERPVPAASADPGRSVPEPEAPAVSVEAEGRRWAGARPAEEAAAGRARPAGRAETRSIPRCPPRPRAGCRS